MKYRLDLIACSGVSIFCTLVLLSIPVAMVLDDPHQKITSLEQRVEYLEKQYESLNHDHRLLTAEYRDMLEREGVMAKQIGFIVKRLPQSSAHLGR